MKLYTSYFARVEKLREMGYDNLVCISGYAPKWFNNEERRSLRYFPLLAPRSSWWREWHDNNLGNDWYVKQYYDTVLSELNPNEVVEELGDKAVMLCYEKPGDFCHRHLVADWIRTNTGVEVEEVTFN